MSHLFKQSKTTRYSVYYHKCQRKAGISECLVFSLDKCNLKANALWIIKIIADTLSASQLIDF